MPLLDSRGRALRDLRVSVTDRCNFRCGYCMPRDRFGADHPFLDREQILTYEEIRRLAGILVEQGVRRIRLTGGEPLLRRDIGRLIEMLASIPRLEDLSLTTNGLLLAEQAASLARAGLRRLTVSLDAVDEALFRTMNDVDAPLQPVLQGIAAASRAGLAPVKINAVVKRGVNDHAVVDIARFFRGTGHVVRFIEYMDVGTTNGWRMDDVVTGQEILQRIAALHPLEPLDPSRPGEVARRYRYRDGQGEIGLITSVSRPFCGDCVRLRLSPEGKLYTCLFAADGVDVREPLRAGADKDALRRRIDRLWRGRDDRYSEIRAAAGSGGDRIEMSYIGG